LYYTRVLDPIHPSLFQAELLPESKQKSQVNSTGLHQRFLGAFAQAS
jgi:hypothetical protein